MSADGDGSAVSALPWLACSLAGLLALSHQYHLLDAPLEKLLGWICAGFIIHYLSPARYKKEIFLAVSLASALALLPPLAVAGLLAFGVALHAATGIQDKNLRVLGLGCLALLPVALRATGALAGPGAGFFWMYFGVLYLFRAFLYWRDRAPAGESLLDCLSYFFMAPALCVPLFPVVDYRLFKRTYRLRAPRQAAWTGVVWISNGMAQLLLFRAVMLLLYKPSSQVSNPVDLLRFCVCAFSSLLKITGGYHIGVGALYLFGFCLPQPSLNFFASKNFLDYWNRSNVYWKNFMLKTVYMPLFLRYHTRGPRFAAVVGGAATFAVTWLLHGALRFWAVGDFHFTGVDALFWGVMGAGVILSLLEAGGMEGHPAAVATGWPRWLSVPVTFLALSLLWGFASMPSIEDCGRLLLRAL